MATEKEAQHFYDLCEKLDWWYEYSNDTNHVKKTRLQYNTLQHMARKDATLGAIWFEMRRWGRSGKGYNNPKLPKPRRP